jgi:hypothetical protein
MEVGCVKVYLSIERNNIVTLSGTVDDSAEGGF